MTNKNKTLFIDLDGTLIHSDLLLESALELVKRNILYIFLLPFWLLRGKAWLKHQIARRTDIDVDLLPYNHALIDYLYTEKQQGRHLVLISASNEKLVRAVAAHLQLFDEAIGSTEKTNLSGIGKLQRIWSLQSDAGFAYAADSAKDLPVWEQADEIIAVNTGSGLLRRLRETGRVSRHFDPKPVSQARELLRAMRPHQWLKNLLLFLPLLLAHPFVSATLLWQTALGVISFCLCASSVYLLNDLLDLPADRKHYRKRFRPFAAGTLPLTTGLAASPTLLLMAFAIALWFLPIYFVLVLGLYFLTTLIYSFLLKKVVLVDVITLAILYTLRIIAGAAAIPVIPSFWLLAFSMFIFLSLAIVKRYTELIWVRESGIQHSQGRGYLAQDLDLLAIFGSSSAFMAVLVFALYINSGDILEQYTTPEILWFICPLLLYLLSRTWLLAYRGELDEDPVVFALRDRISQSVVAGGAALLYLAHLDWRAMLLGTV